MAKNSSDWIQKKKYQKKWHLIVIDSNNNDKGSKQYQWYNTINYTNYSNNNDNFS